MGIRNGIDIDIWDPETDQFLPKHYTADNVVEGKAAAREELRRRLGLTGTYCKINAFHVCVMFLD